MSLTNLVPEEFLEQLKDAALRGYRKQLRVHAYLEKCPTSRSSLPGASSILPIDKRDLESPGRFVDYTPAASDIGWALGVAMREALLLGDGKDLDENFGLLEKEQVRYSNSGHSWDHWADISTALDSAKAMLGFNESQTSLSDRLLLIISPRGRSILSTQCLQEGAQEAFEEEFSLLALPEVDDNCAYLLDTHSDKMCIEADPAFGELHIKGPFDQGFRYNIRFSAKAKPVLHSPQGIVRIRYDAPDL